MKKSIYAFFLIASQLHSVSQSPHVITFFFEEYPTPHTQAHPDKSKKPMVPGIYCSYFGYRKATGHDGQVTFPRSHQQPKFTILVSPDVQPIPMASNTVGFWQLKQGARYAFYSVTKKQDPETKKWLWHVQPTTPPSSAQLPVDTIVIVADPTSIYIPEGVTPTDNNQQLILPPVYVKETIDLPEDTLKALETLNFSHLLQTSYKKEKSSVQTQEQ